MITKIYLRARQATAARGLVEELLADGIEAERIRVHARQPPDLPVPRATYRTPGQALRQGAIIGAATLLAPALALILLSQIPAPGLALLPALGASLGGAWWYQRNEAVNGLVHPQRAALQRGELVIALALERDQVERLEVRLSERHPDVPLLGSDAAGTPPFP